MVICFPPGLWMGDTGTQLLHHPKFFAKINQSAASPPQAQLTNQRQRVNLVMYYQHPPILDRIPGHSIHLLLLQDQTLP